MKRAATIFSDADRQRINDAVAEAESRTAAEIIPVAASVSGRYDRAEDIVGLWLGGAAAVAAWHLLGDLRTPHGQWGEMPAWLKIAIMASALVGGFILGAVAASRIGWLRRLFTPRAEMRDDVLARARSVFFDRRAHHTSAATGLVLYVSLYERRAAVVADEAVTEKLAATASSNCATH